MTPARHQKRSFGLTLVFASIMCFLVLCSCGTGYMWGWTHQRGVEQRTIAFSLGDSMSGDLKGFYAARVYYEPADPELKVVVKLAVEVGPGSNYYHGPIDIGRAATPEEARLKWRKIEWTPDSLVVGEGVHRYVLARSELESHR